jgi:hypothetical protein
MGGSPAKLGRKKTKRYTSVRNFEVFAAKETYILTGHHQFFWSSLLSHVPQESFQRSIEVMVEQLLFNDWFTVVRKVFYSKPFDLVPGELQRYF